ncbi:hypothetical protein GRX03_03005 [Halovenus sp. WSH3]|uniref:Uncharacterized protein n=1 Tax=Halovenus carboxidivorans TaxID=2692199 RepID=A0A6B0SXW3_9EURY|nr:hypothetical protein [Halovenus carboxidivorans]MXR50578.1 hypothetical protein [Halovenus carboxidivorans]
MTLAERAREAARDHPFVHDALAAGVLNYSAAARFLDVGEEEAVAAALRRYGEELDSGDEHGDVRVTMETGLGRGDEGLLTVGETGFAPGEGSLTAVLVTGSVSIGLFRRVLGRCETADIEVLGAGYGSETMLVVVERRDGPDALRFIESVCSA